MCDIFVIHEHISKPARSAFLPLWMEMSVHLMVGQSIIDGVERMNLNDFCDTLTFPLATPFDRHFGFQEIIYNNSVLKCIRYVVFSQQCSNPDKSISLFKPKGHFTCSPVAITSILLNWHILQNVKPLKTQPSKRAGSKTEVKKQTAVIWDSQS